MFDIELNQDEMEAKEFANQQREFLQKVLFEYDENKNENPCQMTSLVTNTIDSEMVGEKSPLTIS